MSGQEFRQRTWRNRGRDQNIIQVSNEADGSLIIAAGWVKLIDPVTREPRNPDEPESRYGMSQPDEHQSRAFTAALMDLMDDEDPREKSLIAPEQSGVVASIAPYWETIDADGDHLMAFRLRDGGLVIIAGCGERTGKVTLTAEQATEFIQVMLTFTCRLAADPPKDIIP